jgi:hypothetical protein
MKRLVLVPVLVAMLAGCQRDDVLTPRSGNPSALIQDGSHNGGNGFFFWLAPVVQQSRPGGQTFSAHLGPVVTITRLLAGGCTAALVRTFSGAEVKVEDGDHYLANWHTAADGLNPDCTYRITVTVGTKELGFADVDVVSNGRELKNVVTGEFVPLLDDRTLPIKFWIGVGALCRTGADCGEGTALPNENVTIISSNARAGTFIPAGAVDRPITIIVESVNDRPCIPGLVVPHFEGSPVNDANSCYRFRTDPDLSEITEDGKFITPVVVGICVDFGDLPHEEIDKLQIFRFDEGFPPVALPNASAPFLPCNASSIGSAGNFIRDLAVQGVKNLFAPAAAALSWPIGPRFSIAGLRMFDQGAGGITDDFSIFTWGLVTTMNQNDGTTNEVIRGNRVPVAPSVIFTDSTGAPVEGVPVQFSVVGEGSITGASVLSDVNGVARVGSWTLGLNQALDTVVATSPPMSGVLNSPQLFTATALTVACGGAPGGDQIDRGFYILGYPGTQLDRVTLHLSARTAGTYTFSLTARRNAFDGTLVGTGTATVTLTANDNANVPTTFTFPSSPTVYGDTIAFAITQTAGPAGAEVFFSVAATFTPGDPSCPVIETEDTTPPLSTFRRRGVHITFDGPAPPVP